MKPMKQLFVIVVALLGSVVSALDISIIPPVALEGSDGRRPDRSDVDRLAGQMLVSIEHFDVERAIVARFAPGDAPQAQSDIDVAGWAALKGFDYVLYGRVSLVGNVYDVEIRLFDRVRGVTRKSFYERGEAGSVDALARSLGRKIVEHVYDLLHVALTRAKRPDRVDVVVAPAAWLPATWDVLAGIARIDCALDWTRGEPLGLFQDTPVLLHYGVGLGYGAMVNAPEHPASVYHGIRVSVPVKVAFDLGEHAFWLGAGPLCEVTIVSITRLHDDPLFLVKSTGGWFFDVGYDRAVGEKRDVYLGVFSRMSLLPEDPVLVTAEFGIRLTCCIGEGTL